MALNKSAFVFLFNIPNFGTWMGSSPEILLEKVESGFPVVRVDANGERRSSRERV